MFKPFPHTAVWFPCRYMAEDQWEFREGVTPASSVNFLVIATVVFGLVQAAFELCMRRRSEKLWFAPTFIKCNNFAFGLFSGAMFLLLLGSSVSSQRFTSFDAFWCHRVKPRGLYA